MRKITSLWNIELYWPLKLQAWKERKTPFLNIFLAFRSQRKKASSLKPSQIQICWRTPTNVIKRIESGGNTPTGNIQRPFSKPRLRLWFGLNWGSIISSEATCTYTQCTSYIVKTICGAKLAWAESKAEAVVSKRAIGTDNNCHEMLVQLTWRDDILKITFISHVWRHPICQLFSGRFPIRQMEGNFLLKQYSRFIMTYSLLISLCTFLINTSFYRHCWTRLVITQNNY